MRTVIVALTAAAVVASPVPATAAPATAAPVPAVDAIAWGPCADPDLKAAGAQCAFVPVPLDHSKPSGQKIKLAVSIVRHKVPQAGYQGIMLANVGGPGAPGLSLALLGQSVPGNAGDGYDWIGFDPRGVGASVPALSCVPDYFAGPRPDYVPRTRALAKTWLARAEAYADACHEKHGELLRHMRTVDHAEDMDYIRDALGEPALNFYGYSWGTYLGQAYATLFPSRVRRMVLDSNVNPKRVWYKSNLDQERAFDRNFRIWTAWVAEHDAVYRLGRTAGAVRKRYYAEQAKLRKRPVDGVGPAEWNDAVLLVAYSEAFWPVAAAAVAIRAHTGDVAAIRELYESLSPPDNDNAYANYLATQCIDAPWPEKWNTWRRDAWRIHHKAPFMAWSNTWFNAPCHFWAAPAKKRLTVDGDGVAPVLVVGETLDAPTPFEGSLKVRQLFPRSRLLAVPGGVNHGASLVGNACVDNKVAAYLAWGELPARRSGNRPDATCPPAPPPDPLARQVRPPLRPIHRF